MHPNDIQQIYNIIGFKEVHTVNDELRQVGDEVVRYRNSLNVAHIDAAADSVKL